MGTDNSKTKQTKKPQASTKQIIQNKTKQSTASPFYSAFDLVLDVQIRSSAIIGGGNGEKMRLSTSESLFQNAAAEASRSTVQVSTPTTANPRSTRPNRDQISVCVVSSKAQQSSLNKRRPLLPQGDNPSSGAQTVAPGVRKNGASAFWSNEAGLNQFSSVRK